MDNAKLAENALQHIINVLGPNDSSCPENGCAGCAYEMREALETAKKAIAALRQNAAGQGNTGTEPDKSLGEVPAPAAPTLAELSAKAGDSLMANALFIDALEKAYRSGKLREIGEGEVVVPREPTEAGHP